MRARVLTATCGSKLDHGVFAVGCDGFQGSLSITFDADQSSFPLHCGSPSWWRCWFRGYVATVCEQALMSAPSLPPVLDAAQSSCHVFMTGPTASCGSMFGHWKVEKSWYSCSPRVSCSGRMRDNAFAVHEWEQPVLRWHGSSSRCPARLPPEFTCWRTRFQRSILGIGEIQG